MMTDFMEKATTNPDAIPQERLTSLMRGHGPRRGHLEDLLKYWRKIMKKPGGFRRCIVILANHPELYPLEPLCAWLHHETTGKWPNEGNHHSGGRAVRRVVHGGRKRNRRKKDFTGSMGTSDMLHGPMAKDSLLTALMQGNQPNVLAFKTSAYRQSLEGKVGFVSSNTRLGRGAQTVGSAATPGDMADVRRPVRSSIFEALTPGGGHGTGLGIPHARIPRRAAGARNQFRCPPGFENGGKFTNSNFSTCGRQILGIPKAGPGSLSPDAVGRLNRLAQDTSLLRSVGDLRSNVNPINIIRAAQIPQAPKTVRVSTRQDSVNLILLRLDKGETFSARIVRRDGVILEPFVGLNTLNTLGEFDDMNDGIFVTAEAARQSQQLGVAELPVLSTGIRAIVFNIPNEGSISVRRVGGDLTEEERNALPAEIARAVEFAIPTNGDPTQVIRSFVDNSNGRYALDESISNGLDNTLITVQRGGEKLNIPQWVFSMYLSRTAPRRDPNTQPYEEVKSINPADIINAGSRYTALNAGNAVSGKQAFSYNKKVLDSVAFYDSVLDLKRVGGRRDSVAGRVGKGSASRVVLDEKLGKHRCGWGTRFRGRFSDSVGSNCGIATSSTLLTKLASIANILNLDLGSAKGKLTSADTVEDQAFHAKLDAATGSSYKDAIKDTNAVSEWIFALSDKIGGGSSSGGIGRSIGAGGDTRVTTNTTQEAIDAMPPFPPTFSSSTPVQITDRAGVVEHTQQRLEVLDKVTDDPAFNEATLGAKVALFDAVDKAASADASIVATADSGKDASGGKVSTIIGNLLDKLSGGSPSPVSSVAVAAPEPTNLPTPDVSPAPPVPTVTVPPKPTKLEIGLGKLSHLLNPSRKRSRKEDVPELKDITDEQKLTLVNAMVDQFTVLDTYFGKRLAEAGIISSPDDPFTSSQLDDYIDGKGKEVGKAVTAVQKARADDWVELFGFQSTNIPQGDVTQEIAASVSEDSFVDRVGRLTAFNRNSILKEAGLFNVPSEGSVTSKPAVDIGVASIDPADYSELGSDEIAQSLKSLSDGELSSLMHSAGAVEDTQSTKELMMLGIAEGLSRSSMAPNTSIKAGPDGHISVADANTALADPKYGDTFVETLETDGYSIVDWMAGDISASDELAVAATNKFLTVDPADLESLDFRSVWGSDFDLDADSTRAGVILIDSHTGKMVMREPTNHFGGYAWTYSKGGIDPDESLPTAALREATEETGIPGIKIIDALPGVYEGFNKSQNVFLIGVIDSSVVNLSTVTTDHETSALQLVSTGSDASDLIAQTTSITGKARDLEINSAVGEWVVAHAWGDASAPRAVSEHFDTSISNGFVEGHSFVKGGSKPGSNVELDKGSKAGSNLSATAKAANGLGMSVKPEQKLVLTKDIAAERVALRREIVQSHKDGVPLSQLLDDPRVTLTDIPSELLADPAMYDQLASYVDSGGRYESVHTGDVGINGMVGYPTFMIRDTITDKQYVVKRPARNDMEHMSESAAMEVSRALGLPMPKPVKFVGDPYVVSGDAMSPSGGKVTKFGDTTNRAMIIEPVANILDSKYGSSVDKNPEQLGLMIAQQYLINEVDNHSSNQVRLVDGNTGATSVFAFDAGKAFLPFNPSYGPEQFGGKFKSHIDSLSPEDKKRALDSMSNALRSVDRAELTRVLTDSQHVDFPHDVALSPEESKRGVEIADFVGERLDGWEAAVGASYPDYKIPDPTSLRKIDTPESVPGIGKFVKKHGDPSDSQSYDAGIGVVATQIQVGPEAVNEVMSHHISTVTEVLLDSAKNDGGVRGAGIVVGDTTNIINGDVRVVAGGRINVGTASNVEYAPVTELRMSLSEPARLALEEHFASLTDQSYTIPISDGVNWVPSLSNDLSAAHDDETQSGIVVPFKINSDTISSIPSLTQKNIARYNVNPALSSTARVSVPEDIPKGRSITIADLGDVKVLLMPQTMHQYNGKVSEGNFSRQLRVLITGDTKQQLADNPDVTIASVLGNFGFDTSPLTETQLRDRAGRHIIEAAKPTNDGGPHGKYGNAFSDGSHNGTVNKLIAQLQINADVTPGDFIVDTSRSVPKVRLSDEAIARLMTSVSKREIPDFDGNPSSDLPGFAHHSDSLSAGTLSSSAVGRSGVFVDRVYGVGGFMGSADRILDKTTNVGGLSPSQDSANGAGKELYLKAKNSMPRDGHFVMFTDGVLGNPRTHYTESDSYGVHDSIHRVDLLTGNPYEELQQGTVFTDVTVPIDEVSFSDGVVVVHADPTYTAINGFTTLPSEALPLIPSLKSLETKVNNAVDLSLERLNSRNVALTIRSMTSGDTTYRLVYWVEEGGQFVPRLGRPVLGHELTAARVTGRLAEYKSPWIGVSSS